MDPKASIIEKAILFFKDGTWIQKLLPFLIDLGLAILIYIVGSWITVQLCKTLNRIMVAKKFDLELRIFLDAILQIVFKFIVIIIALNQLGLNTTSLLALFGAAGLAVGLALKDSLSNFASGVMLILIKPFRVGNFIEAADIMGTVEKITVFNTVVVTGDNKEVLIPNAQIYKGVIINYSARPTRRVDLDIGIGYDDDIKKARDLMETIINDDKRILKDPEAVIAINELGNSSVNFVVRVWVSSADYWVVRWDLLETIKTTFDANGISIPFPQTDVHIYNQANEPKKNKASKPKQKSPA